MSFQKTVDVLKARVKGHLDSIGRGLRGAQRLDVDAAQRGVGVDGFARR